MRKSTYLALQKLPDLLEKGRFGEALPEGDQPMSLSARLMNLHIGIFIAVSLLLFFHPQLHAQDSVTLKEVKIQGNLRVEEEGIRLHLQARAGEKFDSAVVEKDVKSIYRSGSHLRGQGEALHQGSKNSGQLPIIEGQDRDRLRRRPADYSRPGQGRRRDRKGQKALRRAGLCQRAGGLHRFQRGK
jgi:hypothetical protein